MTKGEIVGKKVEVVIDDHGQMSKQSQDGSSKVKDKLDIDTIAWVDLEYQRIVGCGA